MANTSSGWKVPALTFILGAIAMFIFMKFQNGGLNKEVQLANAVADTLKVKHLKDSATIASIQVAQTANPDDFVKMKNQTEQIAMLQDLVNKYKGQLKPGGSATQIATTTTVKTAVKNDTWGQKMAEVKDSVPSWAIVSIQKSDSDYLYIDTTGHVFAGGIYKRIFTYHATLSNKWYTGTVISGPDSTNLALSIINRYSVVVGQKSGHWFADVQNDNPYSQTTSVRTYQVEVPKPPKPSPWGIGIMSGIGVTAGKNVGMGGFIGIGLYRNLIRF